MYKSLFSLVKKVVSFKFREKFHDLEFRGVHEVSWACVN
jgi:hypothetical protein